MDIDWVNPWDRLGWVGLFCYCFFPISVPKDNARMKSNE